MRRILLRLLVALTFAPIPAALGTAAALLHTGAGKEALGRLAGSELSRVFRGQFSVQRLGGGLLEGVDLEGVVIRDTLGRPFAEVDRLRASYLLPNLLAGRFVFSNVELAGPRVRLDRGASGRWNYQEIFRLGEGGPSGGAPALVLLREVRLRHGEIELRLPWTPSPGLGPRARDSAIAAERSRPGRVLLETEAGFRRVIRFDSLEASLSRLQISSPAREPLTIDIAALHARISDPALTITDLAAHVWQRGDSLGFSLKRGALPDTRASGEGFVTWPRGPLLYDFALNSPRVNLADLRWISPDFPAMIGRGDVRAESRGDDLTAYALTSLRLGGRGGRVTGDVTVLLDRARGLGVEGMALELTDLDLDVPRPYLDTLPLRGTLTGRVSGDGFLDGLDLNADVRYLDRDIPEGADTRLRLTGRIVLGGTNGALFEGMRLDTADVDLRTVHRLAPAVELLGRLQLRGALEGPWRNVRYDGLLVHRDGALPESRATGQVALDTRTDTLGFQASLALAPLVFDGVRPSYPGIPIQGAVQGQVELAGTPDSFFTALDVSGELGRLTLRGGLEPVPGRLRAHDLTARFQRLDLSRLSGQGPATAFDGALTVDGVYDSATGPDGALRLDLGPGRVREVGFDTLHLEARGTGAVVAVDTLFLGWLAGRLGASGSIGWQTEAGTRIHGTFLAESLTHFDSLLTTYAGQPDSADQGPPLGGRMQGEVDLLGSLREPRLLMWARGTALRWRGVRAPQAAAGFGWHLGPRPEMGGAVRSDSLVVGRWALRDLNLVAGGYQDSLRWQGGGTVGPGASLSGGGGWWRAADSSLLLVDSLVAQLPEHAWRLRNSVTVGLGTGRITLLPVTLEAADGSGFITLRGTIPGREPGDLTVSVAGLGLRDVYTLLQRDTTGIAGSIQVDLAVGGTAARPTLRGTGSLSDLSFGDFGSPFVQGIVDYADRRLEANLLLWKTGQPVLRVEAQLPLDLALKTVPERQVDGPLSVRVLADSTDLGVAEAFTRNLRRVRGTLKADLTVGGRWEEPRLGGEVRVWGASATVPGLGVRYENVFASATLTGDSIRIDSLLARSGEGNIRVSGVLRVEQLTRPVLDLTMRARRFRFIDDRRFLTLDASGALSLTGPLVRPRLNGRVTADEGDLHFADLITKRIVDLENPGDSGLIDLDLVHTERLGANFQSRFLDSLSIDTLRIEMGESFWLRSSEANIQLDGSLTVGKLREKYRYDGTLNAVRGNYALRIGGLVTREFTVQRGTVRYFGTPDLNADLDIEASHTVIAAETSEEIPVVARITGTMLQPRLELSSSPTSNRPALSQTELVSYLMFGRPTFSLQGQGGQSSQYAAVQAGLSYLTSAFSSEIQRALISDLGVPIDFIDIRTGAGGSVGLAGQSGSAQLAQVAAGWQIGRRWYVTLVADLCTNTQRFYPNAEFRMTRELRLKTSVEPSYSCQVALNQPALSVNKYQVGLDLLWEREY